MILRYVLELSVVIPAIVFAVMPVTGSLKYSSPKFFALTAGAVAFMTLAGAWLCAKYSVRTRVMLSVNVAIISMAYYLFVNLSMTRKLFCLFNSAMLCQFCSISSRIILAPYVFNHFTGDR
ncbi:MAG: hypothetical protein IJG37_08115, partial [Synergistaceae bacterium]|nr:hypothetical protein [Synergistaceae bacterium]